MGSCDASYRFTFVDVGSPGADGDMNVFARTSFGSSIISDGDTLDLPPNGGVETPFFFIADDAFPLNRRIMKPYKPKRNSTLSNEERVFNYRLSRARRTIENAFGILVMRWGCLQSEFISLPEKVKIVVGACCALHNFLINRSNVYATPSHFDRFDEDGNLIEGFWRYSDAQNQLEPLNPVRGRPNSEGISIRERLKKFFFYENVLPFQFAAAHINNRGNE